MTHSVIKMRSAQALVSLVVGFLSGGLSEAQQCQPRTDPIQQRFPSAHGTEYHVWGGHAGGVLFNSTCDYTAECKVNAGVEAADNHYDTGLGSGWAHATAGATTQGSGSSGFWGSSQAMGFGGVAAKECVFGVFCDLTVSVNVGGGGVEVGLGGAIWTAGFNHTHTCPASHQASEPPPPPPPSCWEECHEEYLCQENCADEWACDSYWIEGANGLEWREHCTLVLTCQNTCGWAPVCQQVCG